MWCLVHNLEFGNLNNFRNLFVAAPMFNFTTDMFKVWVEVTDQNKYWCQGDCASLVTYPHGAYRLFARGLQHEFQYKAKSFGIPGQTIPNRTKVGWQNPSFCLEDLESVLVRRGQKKTEQKAKEMAEQKQRTVCCRNVKRNLVKTVFTYFPGN